MRTNINIQFLDSILELIYKLDKKELERRFSSKDKEEIYQFIENEFFSISEIQDLLSSVNIDRNELFYIVYYLIKLYFNQDNNVINKTMLLSKHASNDGFDWPNNVECFNKIEEEVLELKKALNDGNIDNIKEELGDILFTLSSFSRLSEINIIDCLNLANKKFEKRFKRLKVLLEDENLDLNVASSEIKEKFWNKAKKEIESS